MSMSPIDQFLKKLTPTQREQLERIRKIAKETVPETEEVISYGMPTLKYKGKSFLGFNAHSKHIGIYPYGGKEIEVFKDKLTDLGYGFSSGAIRVAYDKPMPKSLLQEIIAYRLKRLARSK